ncbi:MAG TPA: CARDB domain-containing protein [Tepidisphaeraceae bacterium]|jgi:hypothetical protein|nr:CARDB domain-containing protein [Tepidisphaeraceae bacterium]
MDSSGGLNDAMLRSKKRPRALLRWKIRRGPKASAIVEALEGRMLLAADLTLRVAFAGRTLEPGGTMRARVTVRNTGASAAGAFDTTLALSKDRIFGNADDIPLATLSQPDGLAAGAKHTTGSMVLTVPAGTARGKYFLVGKVDSGNAVTESNEGNNTFSSSGPAVRVGVVPAAPATVTITALSAANSLTGAPAQFLVQRTGGSSAALTVFYTFTGTAVSGLDFLPLTGSVTIPSGQQSATILVTPVPSVAMPVPRTITLSLVPGPGYTLSMGGQTSATVAILNFASLGVVAVPGTFSTQAFLTPLASPFVGTTTFVPLSQSAVFPVGTPFVTLPLGQFVAPLAPPTVFTTLGNVLLQTPFGPPPFSLIPLTPVIPPIESPLSFPITSNPFPNQLSPVPIGTVPLTNSASTVVVGGTIQTLTTPLILPAGTFFDATPIGTFAGV